MATPELPGSSARSPERGNSAFRTALKLAVLAVLLCCTSPPAPAAERTKVAFAGKQTVLGRYAQWDAECGPLAAPEIRIQQAPAHGTVTTSSAIFPARVGKGSGTGSPQCKGKPVQGILVLYQPKAGFSGNDTIRYEVRFDGHAEAYRMTVQVSDLTSAMHRARTQGRPSKIRPRAAIPAQPDLTARSGPKGPDTPAKAEGESTRAR